MAVVLPTALPAAAGWVLADYATRQVRSEPAAAGVATIELEQLDGDEMWLIDHAVVSCDSSAPTEVRWYASSITPLSLLDGTARGNFDVGDWPAGLQVRPSQSLIVRWTGISAGARGVLSIQYRVLRRL